MPATKSFEELECWQESRLLVKMVFVLCDSGKLSRDFGTANQIKRAALSVMNNIAEGHGRKSAKEFIRFLDIAQSSAVEVKSMTYILEDLEYIPASHNESLRSKADKVKKIIRGLIRYLENRQSSEAPTHPGT